jgi:hypothetical protein
MVAARIENPSKDVRRHIHHDDLALLNANGEYASELAGAVGESFPLSDYPRIKCNFARRTGDRIYHLPFETLIEADRRERYASTAAKAEQLGFRRAWRWRGRASAQS